MISPLDLHRTFLVLLGAGIGIGFGCAVIVLVNLALAWLFLVPVANFALNLIASVYTQRYLTYISLALALAAGAALAAFPRYVRWLALIAVAVRFGVSCLAFFGLDWRYSGGKPIELHRIIDK